MLATTEQSGGLNRSLAKLFLLVGVGLPLVGVPATFVLGFEGAIGLSVRIMFSGFFYVVTAALLHPRTWERLPLKYMPGRVRTAAFVTFAAGTAVWAS